MHISNIVLNGKYFITVPQADKTISATCVKLERVKNMTELFESAGSFVFETDTGQKFELFAHKYKSANPRLCCRALISGTYKTVPVKISRNFDDYNAIP